MGHYIYFTEEQKRRANSVDLPEFLRRQGERLLPSGRDKRLASDHSVTVRGSRWYDHATGDGGYPIDFVQRYYGVSFPEAVTRLLGGEQGARYETAAERPEPERKPFALPPEHENCRRVFAYLIKRRGIDREVLREFVRAGLIYEDAVHHNAVFVGTDEYGAARHAHKRSTASEGTTFRINVEGSDPRYSFHHAGTSDRLYVFEAPIDMLSFITLFPRDWQRHSYVALCGTGGQAMLWMLERNPHIRDVALCLDNDKAGHAAADRLSALTVEKGARPFTHLPERKDWNDDLTSAHSALADISMKME